MLALYKKKRAVSPVIAVILLIALTVATVAIIWQVVLPLLSTGTVNVTPVTTSATIDGDADGGVWTGVVTVSEAGVLTVSIAGDVNNETVPTLSVNDNAVTVGWDILTAGTYDVIFSFTADSLLVLCPSR